MSMEECPKERGSDQLKAELNQALRKVGELSMENELLREKCKRANIPLGERRSRR